MSRWSLSDHATHIHQVSFIHAYIHAYIYIHTYIHAYRYIHANIHRDVHAYAYAYVHVYIHVCTHACIHAWLNKRMHIYIRTYICMCNWPWACSISSKPLNTKTPKPQNLRPRFRTHFLCRSIRWCRDGSAPAPNQSEVSQPPTLSSLTQNKGRAPPAYVDSLTLTIPISVMVTVIAFNTNVHHCLYTTMMIDKYLYTFTPTYIYLWLLVWWRSGWRFQWCFTGCVTVMGTVADTVMVTVTVTVVTLTSTWGCRGWAWKAFGFQARQMAAPLHLDSRAPKNVIAKTFIVVVI